MFTAEEVEAVVLMPLLRKLVFMDEKELSLIKGGGAMDCIIVSIWEAAGGTNIAVDEVGS
jgi:hypothetical protein